MSRRTGQIRCCAFDLETTSLNADFGVVLCGVVLPGHDGAKPKIFRADHLNKDWQKCRSDDRAVVKAIVEELRNYDVWIAHNGLKFDVPFLRTRLLAHDLPPLPNNKLIDPLQLARSKLRMSWNSLEKLAQHLGCNQKTQVDGEHWLRAALDGDRKSMNYIVDHCIKDVIVLDDVVGALKAYSSTINSWGSGV